MGRAMRDALIVSVLSILPRNRAARLMGWFARSGLSGLLTRAFVRVYGVDLAEAEHGLDAYPTLSALFTRRLKPGARPVHEGDGAMVSPADGAVAWVGTTEGGVLQIAPGRPLSVQALLGEEVQGERDVLVVYLSPKDYHRVHQPVEGTLRRWRYLPGTLWPVFPAAVRRITGLFAQNERAWVQVDTPVGTQQVVLVGAFGVGRIELGCCDLLTNTGGAAAGGDVSLTQTRGAELGIFHLGSTVVVLNAPGTWRWGVAAGDSVRMGQRVAVRAGAQADGEA